MGADPVNAMSNGTPAEDQNAPAQPAEGPSLAKQSLWILSAKTIGFALSVLLPLLIVRHLSQVDVGIYRQAFLVIVSATSILPLGFSMSAYYFLNREPERRQSTVLNIVLFNFLAGAVAFIFLLTYPSALGALFKDEQMTALAPVLGLAIWLAIFSTFLETAALANREPKLATVIIIFTQLTKAALMGGAALFFRSADAIVYAAVLHGAAQTIALVIFLKSRFSGFWRSFDLGFFKEHLRYALPFGLFALVWNAQADLHHYFVASEFSPAEYAIYAYGCFQLPLIGALYESVSAVLLPRMSELQAQGRTREILATTVSGIEKLAFAYFPLFVFLMIVADVFFTTLFTRQFVESVPIFRINLLLLLVYCLILDPVERSFKELGHFLLKIRAVLVIGLAGSLFVGVSRLGMTGIIGIVVAFIFLDRLIALWIVARRLGVSTADFRMLGGAGKALLAAGVSGILFFVFFRTVGDWLLSVSTVSSHAILSGLGLTAGWEFLGGSVFLGVMALIYGSIYLGLAIRLKAIHPSEVGRFGSNLGRIAGPLQAIRAWLFGSKVLSEPAK